MMRKWKPKPLRQRWWVHHPHRGPSRGRCHPGECPSLQVPSPCVSVPTFSFGMQSCSTKAAGASSLLPWATFSLVSFVGCGHPHANKQIVNRSNTNTNTHTHTAHTHRYTHTHVNQLRPISTPKGLEVNHHLLQYSDETTPGTCGIVHVFFCMLFGSVVGLFSSKGVKRKYDYIIYQYVLDSDVLDVSRRRCVIKALHLVASRCDQSWAPGGLVRWLCQCHWNILSYRYRSKNKFLKHMDCWSHNAKIVYRYL